MESLNRIEVSDIIDSSVNVELSLLAQHLESIAASLNAISKNVINKVDNGITR